MKARNHTKNLAAVALFAALIALGAFLRVPVPVVPFTLQTFFVALAGLLLGSRLGFLAALVYLVMGLIGIPVFTEGGGLAYVLKPSFGYIIGFAFGAAVTGAVAGKGVKPSFARALAACLAGLAVIYAIGVTYFYFVSNYAIGAPIGVWTCLLHCFLLCLPGDLAFSIVAVFAARAARPALGKTWLGQAYQ